MGESKEYCEFNYNCKQYQQNLRNSIIKLIYNMHAGKIRAGQYKMLSCPYFVVIIHAYVISFLWIPSTKH